MSNPHINSATSGKIPPSSTGAHDGIEFIVLETDEGQPHEALFVVEHNGERIYVKAEDMQPYTTPNQYRHCLLVSDSITSAKHSLFYDSAHERLSKRGITD